MRYLTTVLVLVAGCYSPKIPNGMQLCTPEGLCADGYECKEKYCWLKGSGSTEKMCSETCKAPTPNCDKTSGTCVACTEDTHCPIGKICKNKGCSPGCSASHGCAADGGGFCALDGGTCVACTNDASCSGATPRCDTNSGLCVACVPMNDNCPIGKYCSTTGGQFKCVDGCKADGTTCATDGGNFKCCNHACVNIDSDAQNCGTTCSKCTGQFNTCCLGSCVDVKSDISNCSQCGAKCPNPSNTVQSWKCEVSGQSPTCKVKMCQPNLVQCTDTTCAVNGGC